MSTEKVWNQDEILKSIDSIQQSENIWNSAHNLYKNRIRRTDSINEIADTENERIYGPNFVGTS